MRTRTIATTAVFFLLQSSIFASQNVKPKELTKICYDTVDNSQFCTTDNLGKVQVYVYNAGWCPLCNTEMHELSGMHKQFEGKDVVFASLSGEGYQRSTKPDKVFLESWKKKHKIPFIVAGKYKDFGKAYGATGSIPFSVVVDREGNIAANGNMSANQIINKVNELLADETVGSCLPDVE